MQRRGFFQLSAAASAVAVNGLLASRASAQTKPAHDHAAMMGDHDHAAMMAAMAQAGEAKPRRFDALVKPFQACTAAVAVCTAHCQTLLAQGDKSMGACLRTALDCDVTCGAALKAAGLNSDFTPELARTSVAAMEACVKACKPHVGHHAECKACHDACLVAIEAAKKLG